MNKKGRKVNTMKRNELRKEDLTQTRQYKQFIKRSNRITIELGLATTFKINAVEVLIYSYILNHTKFGRYKRYMGSRQGLCTLTYSTLPTATKALDHLIEIGLLRKEKVAYTVGNIKKTIITYTATLLPEDPAGWIEKVAIAKISNDITKNRVLDLGKMQNDIKLQGVNIDSLTM